MNFTKAMIAISKLEDLKQKSGQISNNTSKGTFYEVGSEFISLIKLARRLTWNKYILVVIDYAIKWVEAKALRTNFVVVTTKFCLSIL